MKIADNSGRKLLLQTLIVVFVCYLFMFGFQYIKTTIFPNIDLHESHQLTNIIGTLVLSLMFYLFKGKMNSQKQLIKNIKENEIKYTELAESISDIFFAMDRDLKYTYWNKASESFTGIKSEDAIGKFILDLFPDDESTKNAYNFYKEVIVSSRPRSFISVYNIKENKIVFEINAYPTSSGITVIAKDISEKIRLEEEFKANALQTKAMLNAIPDWMFRINSQFKVLDYKAEKNKLYNQSVDNLIGKKLYEILPKDVADIIMFNAKSALLNGNLQLFEYDINIPNIGLQIFEVRMTKINDNEVVAIVRNVTENRKNAKDLIDNNKNLDAIINSSPNSVVLIDINGIIIKCNPTAMIRLGKSVDELVGREYHKFLPREYSQVSNERIQEVVFTAKPVNYIQGLNGRVYNHHLTPILNENACVDRIAIYSVDISEYIHNQEVLKRQNELSESIRKALELFISGKNPYGIYLELLQLLVNCTGSEYGFLDEVLYDTDGSPYKLSLAMSDISWDKESKELYQKLVERKLEFRNLDNLAGLPVLLGRTIIANDVEHHPNYKGTPKGHPVLKKYMGIPLYFGNNLIGVAAVANSAKDYTKELAEFISPLLKTCSVMIWANRLLDLDKEYLKTIEQSEEKYRRIVTTAQEGVWIIDNQAQTTFVNECLCSMFGYTEAEMMGRSLFEFMDDDGKIEAVEYFKRREQGISEKHDFRFKRKDGSDLWVMLATNAMTNEKGEFVGALGMLMDITERKLYELQIEQNQFEIRLHKERLEALLYLSQLKETSVENILDYALEIALNITQSQVGYIYHYDENTEQFTLFSWSNQAMKDCKIVEKQTIYKLANTGIWGEAVRQRKPIMVNNFDAPNEFKKGYPEGHVPLHKFLTVPVVSDNSIVAVIGVGNKEFDYDEYDVNQLILLGENVWNICIRKYDEEKIRNYAQKMKELNIAKDKFFSIIAHDLRNPIGNFKELSKILMEEYDDLTEEEKISFLKVMQESSSKLYTLMENLLEWSRSQRGLIDTNMERFDLYFIVHECKEVLHLSAANKRIKIVNNIEYGTYVFGNSNIIKTVVRNLISNAIKFSYIDKEIVIGIDNEVLSDEIDKICIYVRDYGVGISPDSISKLFRIDEHYTTYGTSGESGTGLGLVLCREFIEKHNCKIWVESELGIGTTFYFTLPISNN